MELFNPINQKSVNFDVGGAGTVDWDHGLEYVEDANGHVVEVKSLDRKGLGIWEQDGGFYRVKTPDGTNLRQLAKQVKEGIVTVLEMEWKETDRPEPGEATDTFGPCPDRTQGPDKGLSH